MGLKAGSFAGAIIIGTLVTAMQVPAQESSSPTSSARSAPASDLPLADYQAFDGFAVAHPEIVSELSHNPNLIEDDGYVSRHPELRDFLASHAELRSALIKDPGDFLEPNSRRKPE